MVKLDKRVRHLGTYFNFRNIESPGYAMWDEDRKGFMIRCAKTHRPFKDVAFQDIGELRVYGARFEPSGKTEPTAKA